MSKKCPVCRAGSLLLESKQRMDLDQFGRLHKTPLVVASSLPEDRDAVNPDHLSIHCTKCKKAFPVEKTKHGIIRIKQPKIFIALVVWNAASATTESQILEAMMHHGRRTCECCGEESGFIVGRGRTGACLLPVARTNAVKMFLKTDATHILFIDQDTVEFDAQCMLRMAAHDLPIVSAYICRRSPPFDPVHRYMGDGCIPTVPQPDEAETIRLEEGGVEECWGVGMAFTLIKREVLEAVGDPYFRFVPAGYHTKDPNSGWFNGEDFSFCEIAREKGYSNFVDCGIHLGHMREEPTSVVDWFKWYEDKQSLDVAEQAAEEENLIKDPDNVRE